MFTSSPAMVALFEVVHALRMELGFLFVVALFWTLTSGITKSDPGKKAVASKPAPLPPTRPTSGSACAAQAKRRCEVNVRDPERASDPQRLLDTVQQLCRTSVPKAIKLYREALKAGLDLTQMPKEEVSEFFVELVISAIRAGLVADAIGLLRDCRQASFGTAALLASCIKLCTSKQLFRDCLAIYDIFAEDASVKLEEASAWSCLLFCAVETQTSGRCHYFFKNLRFCGTASGKDFGNMVRFAAAKGDWQLSLEMIQEMRQSGVDIDSIAYNTALGTCVAADRTAQARALLDDMECCHGVVDVVTYNTLSKGFAKLGRLDECFELFRRMKANDISPSQISYGILLDCCINQKETEKAAAVFDEMTAAGLVMNTVLYTTLIKGFARADEIDKAMKVYEQMRNDKASSPDLITFSILIKANCDANRLDAALVLLQTMLDVKISPDEVVFNNLLGGCIRENKIELAKGLYNAMVERGVKPSTATFSILIRVYAQHKMFHEAIEMLKTEPKAHNMEPEQRLYVQLAQACLRERQGRCAIEVYKSMFPHTIPTAATHGSLIGLCLKLNMLDTGAEVLAAAAENRGRVDVRDALQLRDAALRKKKVSCAEAIAAAMTKLGMDASPA